MSNWIEIAKLVVSISTPLLVAGIGFVISKRLKSIEEAQWQSRKIIDKRLDLFDRIAPDLNKMFCFSMWLGYWKEISPREMIDAKRELDKVVNIYGHLLSNDFYLSYNNFIHTIFQTFTGPGKDALILSEIFGADGDRRKDAKYTWEKSYEGLFSSSDVPKKEEVRKKYNAVMAELRKCIGLRT